MRHVAIKKIMKMLVEKGVDISSMKALDFFAREGDWQTMHYANLVSETHAWEIDPSFEQRLRDNLPKGSKITIGDSFQIAKMCKTKFDMIVIDNPQGCFGKELEHCEHFEALTLALPLLKKTGILVFNVKMTPFDYDDKIEWKNRRNAYYGIDATCLDDKFVYAFYSNFFSQNGFLVDFSFMVERPQEKGLSAYVTKITRVEG